MHEKSENHKKIEKSKRGSDVLVGDVKLVDSKKLEIAKVDLMAKFSTGTYSKILINGSKGLLRLLCFEPNQFVPLHRHPKGDEYFFVIKGKGTVTVGSEKANVKVGCIIWAPAGVMHQWKAKTERLILLSVLISPSSYELADEATKMELSKNS